MEMKYVVPDMAQSFGTLEFAGESEPVFERDKNNRRVLARRSYNLYSDVQKGENVVVEIPVQAGEKHFKYEQKVKLVNPKLYGRGYAIGDEEFSADRIYTWHIGLGVWKDGLLVRLLLVVLLVRWLVVLLLAKELKEKIQLLKKIGAIPLPAWDSVQAQRWVLS